MVSYRLATNRRPHRPRHARSDVHKACGQTCGQRRCNRVSRLMPQGRSNYGENLTTHEKGRNRLAAHRSRLARTRLERAWQAPLPPGIAQIFPPMHERRPLIARNGLRNVHNRCGQSCGHTRWNRVSRFVRQGRTDYGETLTTAPAPKNKPSPLRQTLDFASARTGLDRRHRHASMLVCLKLRRDGTAASSASKRAHRAAHDACGQACGQSSCKVFHALRGKAFAIMAIVEDEMALSGRQIARNDLLLNALRRRPCAAATAVFRAQVAGRRFRSGNQGYAPGIATTKGLTRRRATSGPAPTRPRAAASAAPRPLPRP